MNTIAILQGAVGTARSSGRSAKIGLCVHLQRILPTVRNQEFYHSSTASTSSSSSSSNDSRTQNSPRVTLHHLDRGIVHVQLSRPDKLNALDMPMFRALAQTARELAGNSTVRAVILSGQGKAFCTGLDVKSVIFKENPLAAAQELLHRPESAASNLAQDVAYLWRKLPVPVIAAVHGKCWGGGCQIALGADIRLATPNSEWSIMETKWGLIPDMSISVTLRELVRIDIAKELTWTGRIFSGTEAAQLGIVTRCVEDSHDAVPAALAMAEQIVQRSPDAVALAKQLYQQTRFVTSERACLELESTLQRQLLPSWNQLAAASRNMMPWKVPYRTRQEVDMDHELPVDDEDVTASSMDDLHKKDGDSVTPDANLINSGKTERKE